MEDVKLIIVDDGRWRIENLNMRIWPGATFVIRLKDRDVTLQNDRLIDGVAHCTMVEDQDVLPLVASA